MVADIVMSLDNVIAVAAAANGSIPLLILGLAISIPLIIAGAALIMAVLDRLPILVWAGAALLGWIAGEVIATDPAVHPKLQRLLRRPRSALKLDATARRSFGVAPHFADADLASTGWPRAGMLSAASLGSRSVVLVVGIDLAAKRRLNGTG